MKVILKQEDYEKIVRHAVSELPDEACGLLAGRDEDTGEGVIRRVEKVYLLTNTDHSNEHFTLDPKEQLKAVKDMRSLSISPIGNWHSHPESPSRSSEEDIRLAFDSMASYFILSLMDKAHPVLHSFHVENGISEEEELEIIG